MQWAKRRRATVPFFMMLATLVACSQDGPAPRDTHVQAGAAALPVGCVALDEFTPALASWATVLTTGTADANGFIDITTHLQTAIDSLTAGTLNGGPNGSGPLTSTLYIPPGAWAISDTINVRYGVGINIVGADPATTIIKWTAPEMPYPDMFRISDASHIKFSRLTLDGNGQARIGVHLYQSSCYTDGQILKGNPTAFFDPVKCHISRDLAKAGAIPALTGAEFNDDVFKGLQFGFVAGLHLRVGNVGIGALEGESEILNLEPGLPNGFSDQNGGEVFVRRSRFTDISVQAASFEGNNVLNNLIADSEFTKCNTGISVTKLGSVSVVNNYFHLNGLNYPVSGFSPPLSFTRGSDISMGGSVPTVIRENVSIGSREFLKIGMQALLSSVDVSGNYIEIDGSIAFRSNAAIETSITQMTVFDNYIEMKSYPSGSVPVAVQLQLPPNNGYLASNPRMTDGGNTFITSDPQCSSVCGDPLVGEPCSFYKRTYGNGTQRITADDNHCVSSATTAPVPAAANSAFESAHSPVVPVASTTTTRPVFDANVTPVTVVDSVTNVMVNTTIANHCLYKGVGQPTLCGAAINKWLTDLAPSETPFLLFPKGAYYLDKTIEVPANMDIVIGGEGLGSVLVWVGTSVPPADSYMFHLNSPSKATIRDLKGIIHPQVPTAFPSALPGGVLIDSPDVVGGLVYMDAVGINTAKSAFDVLGLDNVAVRADLSGAAEVERVIGVTGGGKAASALLGSSGTQGLLMVAGGSASRASYIELKNWGKAVLINADNEGGTQGIDLNQSGYLTLATGRFLPLIQEAAYQPFYADQPNIIIRSTFRGRATFMGLSSTHSTLLAAAATPEAQILSLDNWYERFSGEPNSPLQALEPSSCPSDVDHNLDCSFYTKLKPSTTTQMALQDGSRCGSGGLAYCDNLPSGLVTNATTTREFVTTMLADERAARMKPPSACASTAVRLHRLNFLGNAGATPGGFMGPGIRVQRF